MVITYCSERENQILFLNNELVNTTFESKTRQVFDQGGECYVWEKDTKLLKRLSFSTYITLLLKLEKIVEYETKEIKDNRVQS